MIKNRICLLIILVVNVIGAQDYQTHTYFKNDSIQLDLDLFVPKQFSDAPTPLVIFVHGGGFSSGDRSHGHQLGKYLANQNIALASISYSLYMKDKNFGCNGILSEKIKAIRLAVNELWEATSYLIEKSDQINIDPTKIFIAGSSAGAETILHASYWDRNQMKWFTPNLLPNFKYAGIISAAGAIMDLNLIKDENKVPTLFFHGDSDLLVPYKTAAHHFCKPDATGWLMLFGSYSITRHLESLDGVAHLVTFDGGQHPFAGEYIDNHEETIHSFIKKVSSDKTFILYDHLEPYKKGQN